jgi:hypothetical protein
MLPRITRVRPLDGYRLELTFSEGSEGTVDLTDWIVGQGGVLEPLEDPAFFRQVRVNEELGTVEWPGGVDFCPDVLYAKLTGKPVPGAARPAESQRG